MKLIKHCGEVGGNVSLLMKGGCGKPVDLEDAYRCTGCGKWFHLDCIFNHFEQEHDDARYYLKLIEDRTSDPINKKYCKLGLERKKPSISLPNLIK